MFAYVVSDDSHEDASGASIQMDDYGNLFLKCHPTLLDKVIDGIEQSQGIKLEAMTKDEWEKENHRLFSKS